MDVNPTISSDTHLTTCGCMCQIHMQPHVTIRLQWQPCMSCSISEDNISKFFFERTFDKNKLFHFFLIRVIQSLLKIIFSKI